VRAHKGPQIYDPPNEELGDFSGLGVVRLVGVGYPFRGGQAHK